MSASTVTGKPRRSIGDNILKGIVLCVLFLLGALVFRACALEAYRFRSAKNWSHGTGIVTGARVYGFDNQNQESSTERYYDSFDKKWRYRTVQNADTSPSRLYAVAVSFNYEVSGERFSGTFDSDGYENRSMAQLMAGKTFKPGASVSLRYDPGNPSAYWVGERPEQRRTASIVMALVGLAMMTPFAVFVYKIIAPAFGAMRRWVSDQRPNELVHRNPQRTA